MFANAINIILEVNIIMFGRKKKNFARKLILDIGTQYVKIVDMTVKKDQAILHNYKILNLISAGRRFIGKEISKIIKKSILDMKINDNLAYTSIAGKSVIVRIMDMPKMTEKELRSSLKYQSDLRLPFNLSEAYFDCKILPNVAVPADKMKVIIAAAPKKEAGKFIDLIKGAGLLVRKIDVDTIALPNAYEWGAHKGDDGSYALVNIGASRTNLTIISNGVPFLCRELNNGGISFTEAIASQLSISWDEAEEKKIKGDNDVLEIIEESLAPLSTGIAQSIDFFEGSSGTHINQIYLSGGGAQIRGIIDYLKSSLNHDVLIWNPLRNFNIDEIEDRELLQANAPLLTISLGIGLSEIEE